MKKAIATALALLLTSCGYVLVDQKFVDRVTVLESQVQELREMHGLVTYPTAAPTTVKPVYTTAPGYTNPVETWVTQEPSSAEPTTAFWGNVSCSVDLPQSFVSKTGAGVITITEIAGRCESFVVEPDASIINEPSQMRAASADKQSKHQDADYDIELQGEMLGPSELFEELSSVWHQETSHLFSGDEYELSTVPPTIYRYETTIQIKGHVSEEFLTSGKTSVHIRLSCDDFSWYTRYCDFSIAVADDGTFSQMKTIPYNIDQINRIVSITAE